MCLGEFTNIRITMEADEATVRGLVRHDHTSLIHSLCFPFFFLFFYLLFLCRPFSQFPPSFLLPFPPFLLSLLRPSSNTSFLPTFLPFSVFLSSSLLFYFRPFRVTSFLSSFFPFFVLPLKLPSCLFSFLFLCFPFIFNFV